MYYTITLLLTLSFSRTGLCHDLEKGYLASSLLKVYEMKNGKIVKLVEMYKCTVKYNDERAGFSEYEGLISDHPYVRGRKKSYKS